MADETVPTEALVGQPSAVCPYCGWTQQRVPTYDVFVEQGLSHEDAACLQWQCEHCGNPFLVTQVVEVTYSSSPPPSEAVSKDDLEEYRWLMTQAEPEGWAIFDTSRGLEIERDDESCVFCDDPAVWRHLEARRQRGDETAVRAFAFIEKFNPQHLTDIQIHLRDWEQQED